MRDWHLHLRWEIHRRLKRRKAFPAGRMPGRFVAVLDGIEGLSCFSRGGEPKPRETTSLPGVGMTPLPPSLRPPPFPQLPLPSLAGRPAPVWPSPPKPQNHPDHGPSATATHLCEVPASGLVRVGNANSVC